MMHEYVFWRLAESMHTVPLCFHSSTEIGNHSGWNASLPPFYTLNHHQNTANFDMVFHLGCSLISALSWSNSGALKHSFFQVIWIFFFWYHWMHSEPSLTCLFSTLGFLHNFFDMTSVFVDQMDSWLGNRKRILVLNREDMVSTADRNAWATYFSRQGTKVIFANGQHGMVRGQHFLVVWSLISASQSLL